MQYVLVKDRQFILLGPIEWRARFIQSELDDLGIAYSVPQTEPNGYLKINNSIEIFNATLMVPNHDPVYQQLEGPYWNFDNNYADGWYYPVDKDLNIVKGDLKKLAATERYRKEIAGTTLSISGTEVTVDTSRDGRAIYSQQYTSMTASSSINWKFPEGWLTLTKSNVQSIITAINSYVQQQFTWEKSICDSIDAAVDKDSLRALTIVEPDLRVQGVI